MNCITNLKKLIITFHKKLKLQHRKKKVHTLTANRRRQVTGDEWKITAKINTVKNIKIRMLLKMIYEIFLPS